jgi:peroxiredoxin
VQVLAISNQEQGSPADKIKTFRKEHGLTYPILSDQPATILTRFGFDGFPSNAILDKNDRYVAAPDTVEEMAAKLKALTR